MPRLLSLVLLALLAPTLFAAELDGHYHATLDGQPAEIILRSQGQRVEGQYVENRHLRLNLKGHYDGQLLRAEISDPHTGLIVANMNATYGNAMLNASIAARDPRNGQVLERQALFKRGAQAAAPTPSAPPQQHLDPALIGTWFHEKQISSGGANFASLATLMTLQLGADGRVAQWSLAAGGGSDWSFNSPGELQYRGRWHSENGVLMVQQEGAAEYQPAAYYRFIDQYLVTESNTGKLIWQRRQ